jgi:hypothetical protein
MGVMAFFRNFNILHWILALLNLYNLLVFLKTEALFGFDMIFSFCQLNDKKRRMK